MSLVHLNLNTVYIVLSLKDQNINFIDFYSFNYIFIILSIPYFKIIVCGIKGLKSHF